MGGKGGSKKSVVGYKYFINLHFAICHGPVSAIHSIWWADKKVWSGDLKNPGDDSQGFIAVNNTGIFGGDTSEGGVGGPVEVGFGGWGQKAIGVGTNGAYSANAVIEWMRSLAPGPPNVNNNWADLLKLPFRPNVKVPAIGLNYRGLAVMLMHDHYIGNNAYLKDISIEVSCYWDDWHPELCKIGDDMNPIHIIRECLVNPEWGLGYDPSTVSETAYLAAAKTLYDEAFGMSLVWDDDQDIDSFIGSVKDCINAATFLDPKTGLWSIKLIRAGEIPSLTIDLDNSHLVSFTRRTLGETYNEISAKYTNPENEEYETQTVSDPANIEAQGRVVPATKEYLGIRKANLAINLAERDLQIASAQLCAAEVECNRSAWALTPGMTITFNWPRRGISNMVMRVNEVTIAAVGDEGVTVSLVEDVFSRASGKFAGEEESGWVDPAKPASLFPLRYVWEYPFWFLVRATNLPVDVIPSMAGFSTEIVSGGNDNAQTVYLYSHLTTVSGLEWVLVAVGAPTPSASIMAMEPEVLSVMQLNPEDSYRLASAETNSFILLTDGSREEIVQIKSFTETTLQATVARGLMDTQPVQWAAGTRAYFIGATSFPVDDTTRSYGEEAVYRPAMQTSLGQMDIAQVPSASKDLTGRYELPYPVANVRVGGEYWPRRVIVQGTTLDITWANRNRVLQDAATQVPWDSGNISPEEGTTVIVEAWANGDILYRLSGINGVSHGVPVHLLSDGDVEIRIYTERGGRTCFIPFTHTVEVVIPSRAKGYGNSFGFNYGE